MSHWHIDCLLRFCSSDALSLEIRISFSPSLSVLMQGAVSKCNFEHSSFRFVRICKIQGVEFKAKVVYIVLYRALILITMKFVNYDTASLYLCIVLCQEFVKGCRHRWRCCRRCRKVEAKACLFYSIGCGFAEAGDNLVALYVVGCVLLK